MLKSSSKIIIFFLSTKIINSILKEEF